MSAELDFPQVEVSVVVLERGGLLLAEFNPNWKTFTLPMARLRRLHQVGGPSHESPMDAAVRAAATALGRPLPPAQYPQPLTVALPPHYQLSGREQWKTKRYTYRPFARRVTDSEPRHALGWHTLWLKRGDFLTHQPISPSAMFVIEHLPEHLFGA